MLSVEDTTLLVLGAGRSTRFGDIGSKLSADFLGRPLALHVATALESLPFRERIVVAGPGCPDFSPHGYATLNNPRPDAGLASSIRIGVASAKDHGAAAVLIALADMPRVTAAHVLRLFDASRNGDTVVASSDGRDPKPPVLFGADRFDFLLALEGDEGARDLVRSGRHVVTSPAELIDVDTPEELERLRGLVRTAR